MVLVQLWNSAEIIRLLPRRMVLPLLCWFVRFTSQGVRGLLEVSGA
jgi:hypothetical protein